MRTVTEIITCDRCGAETTRTYNETKEMDVTATIGTMYTGRPLDLCPKCIVAALRARADEIERGVR